MSESGMRIIVKKFGGSSVATIEKIRSVAKKVADYKRQNPDARLAVVVSAMSGETDRLLKLAQSCVAKPEARELDVLASTGEQVTSALLTMALNELGVSAQSFSGMQAGIKTDNNHQSAQVLSVNEALLLQVLNKDIVAVVAGFQGATHEGDVTTLGRGGSDITAVALAAALKADSCMIYSDIDGVYSADPRLCRHAKRLEVISHEEMLELASHGAKVLHPRCVEFANRYAVPLVALSTFKAGGGTHVVSNANQSNDGNQGERMELPIISGVTRRDDEAKLTVTRLPGGIASLSDIFATLSEGGIMVDMITQTGTEGDRTVISFTVPDEASSKALSLIQALVPKLNAEGALLDRDICKVSVVGSGMRTHSGVAARMFGVLAKEGIEVGMISTSEVKISVLVSRKYGDIAVRALHKEFIES